jgi:hypothetical protein
MNGLAVNQLNVNNWYEKMNISVNSLKSNVIGSWINWNGNQFNVKPNWMNISKGNLVVINIHWLLYDCWLIVYNSLSVNEIESYEIEFKLEENKLNRIECELDSISKCKLIELKMNVDKIQCK